MSDSSTTEITADDLSDIVDSAAALVGGVPEQDSEDPEQPDEEDAEPDDETDPDDDLEDEDPAWDSLDEADDESEEDEEGEEGEDDEEDESSEALSLDDDRTVRLSDGTELTAKDLREGYLRQQDYTQKTQRLADTYRKMEQWYESRANDPKGWIAEIAYQSGDDPSEVIAGAFTESGQATVLLGQTLKHLVESGEVADELVEALNLQQVAEQVKENSLNQKVESLEQQVKQRDEAERQRAEQQRVEQVLNQQWQNVVSQHGLEFDSQEEQFRHKSQVLQFARDRQIPDLEVAYAAMVQLNGGQANGGNEPPARGKQSGQRKQADEAVKSRKRKSSAMSRKPTGKSEQQTGQQASGRSDGDIVKSAGEQALEELGLFANA